MKNNFDKAERSYRSLELLLGSLTRGMRLHMAVHEALAPSVQCLSGGAIEAPSPALSGTMLTPGGSLFCGVSHQHHEAGVEVFGLS